jgi:hypothetical protein
MFQLLVYKQYFIHNFYECLQSISYKISQPTAMLFDTLQKITLIHFACLLKIISWPYIKWVSLSPHKFIHLPWC